MMRDWRRAVVYQVYIRSFRDSDGDGTGDLAGVTASLPYLAGLGVTAIWLSPIHPTGGADLGYDVCDYTGVDHQLGTVAVLDEVVYRAHAAGIAVLLDWVVNHTSDRHPWFIDARSAPSAAHRDWYLFRPGRAPGQPPNNWRSMFGGPAWSYDEPSGEWYLHTFFAGQPDLDWRRPGVRAAVGDAMRFWLDRGIDGFRLDVLPMFIKDDGLRDNPDNPAWRVGDPDYWRQKPRHTVDQPEMASVIGFLRGVVDAYRGRVLLAEMGLPPARLARYHDHIHVPLNFGLITEPWTARRLAARIRAYLDALTPPAWPNWVLGSHDVSRVATRLGPDLSRAAAVLQLTLPGTVTIYNGDELGLPDSPVRPPVARDPLGRADPAHSRDAQRAPMPWDGSRNAGFSTGEPWLPVYPDAASLSVAAQISDRDSMLTLYQRLVRLRQDTPGLALDPVEDLSDQDGVLTYRRGAYQVAANLSTDAVPVPAPGRLLLSSHRGRLEELGATSRITLRPAEAVIIHCGS